MKKIILSLLAAVACMSVNAQVIKVYENGTLSHTYTNTSSNTVKVVFEEAFTPQYVDLGLPSGTLWATCNVGATTPEEYGDYFAWGETEPQADNAYSWASYECANGTSSTLTKYCVDSSYGNGGFVDYKTVLDAVDDAATANWGTGWCMPTDTQFSELRENCTWTWTTDYNGNGVAGYIVSSKATGNTNSIFLPAGGFRNYGLLNQLGNGGFCWTRSLGTSETSCAWLVCFSSSNINKLDYSRNVGLSVRPVRASQPSAVSVTSVSLNKTSITAIVGSSKILMATVTPSSANQNVSWMSSNSSVADVDATGKVTGVAEGIATIIVNTDDGNKIAICEVTVTTATAHDYVDLGLPSGTLWATCNVGATTTEGYGDYFAWGETEPQADNAYSWESYKWCDDNQELTKYCSSDNKTVLDAVDDAATANWGSDWCMPTVEQQSELFNGSYTTTEWTTLNGVYGCKITSNTNGNSIFLPAAGLYSDGSPGRTNDGVYWSSSRSSDCDGAYVILFSQSYRHTNGYTNRCLGLFVRPVRSKSIDRNLLPGQFSVSATKKVQFTKSNLYWDGSAYKFEANAYDYPTEWDANHVGHFFWNTPEDVAAGRYPYAQTFSKDTQTTSDEFFCGENNKMTVDGSEGLYILSNSEWEYLFETRTNARSLYKTGVTVSEKVNCVIIAPDDYAGTLSTTYTAEAWATAEADGLVCLPAAGARGTYGVNSEGEGSYWSSSPSPLYGYDAVGFSVYSSSLSLSQYGYRSIAQSLRLVKTVE